jgi:hypothetical protein
MAKLFFKISITLFALIRLANAFGQAEIEYGNLILKYTANIDPGKKFTVDDLSTMTFTSYADLDLSFYKGALWTRLEIQNFVQPAPLLSSIKMLSIETIKFFA